MKLPTVTLQRPSNVLSTTTVRLTVAWRGEVTSFLNKSYDDWVGSGRVNEYLYKFGAGIVHRSDFEKVRHAFSC